MTDPLIIDLDAFHLWLAERGRNSKSYGSHAHVYEIVARKMDDIIYRHKGRIAGALKAERPSTSAMHDLICAIIQDDASYDTATNTWDTAKAATAIISAFDGESTLPSTDGLSPHNEFNPQREYPGTYSTDGGEGK